MVHPFLVPPDTHVVTQGGTKWMGYNKTLLVTYDGDILGLPLFRPQEMEHGYNNTALVTMGGMQGPPGPLHWGMHI